MNKNCLYHLPFVIILKIFHPEYFKFREYKNVQYILKIAMYYIFSTCVIWFQLFEIMKLMYFMTNFFNLLLLSIYHEIIRNHIHLKISQNEINLNKIFFVVVSFFSYQKNVKHLFYCFILWVKYDPH